MESVTTTTPITTKRYTKCGQEKPITEFSKNKYKTDGYNYTCKECASKYHKQWYNNKAASKRSEPTPYTQNPEFADKTPRELQDELRKLKHELIARGFNCEVKLTFLHEINI